MYVLWLFSGVIASSGSWVLSIRYGAGAGGLVMTAHAQSKSAQRLRAKATLYAKPSRKSDKLGSLKKGARVTVLKTRKSWVQVEASGQTGWISAKALGKTKKSAGSGGARNADAGADSSSEGAGDPVSATNRSDMALGAHFGYALIGNDGGSIGAINLAGEFLFNFGSRGMGFYVGPFFRYFTYSVDQALDVDGKMLSVILNFGLNSRILFGNGSFRWGPSVGLGYGVFSVELELANESQKPLAEAVVETSQPRGMEFNLGLALAFEVAPGFDVILNPTWQKYLIEGIGSVINIQGGVVLDL